MQPHWKTPVCSRERALHRVSSSLLIFLLPEFAQKSINILILKNQAHFSLQTIESIILVHPLQPYRVQIEALIMFVYTLDRIQFWDTSLHKQRRSSLKNAFPSVWSAPRGAGLRAPGFFSLHNRTKEAKLPRTLITVSCAFEPVSCPLLGTIAFTTSDPLAQVVDQVASASETVHLMPNVGLTFLAF